MLTPFHDNEGTIHFPYQALQSVVFIYPVPPPKTLGKEGLIELPVEFREFHQDKTGIVLSIGPGYYNKKNKWIPVNSKLKPGTKVYFDNTVPWDLYVVGLDGQKYKIYVCVEADIFGIVKE